MRRHVLQGGLLAMMVMISGVAGIPHASAQEEPSPFFINPGLNDAWWFGTKGQGFLFTVLPQTKAVFLAWFTFDTERPPQDVSAILGDPGHRWFTALGLMISFSLSGGVVRFVQRHGHQLPAKY